MVGLEDLATERCPQCGSETDGTARYCHRCGAAKAQGGKPIIERGVKSATAAVIMSVILPGLGHLYAEENGLGYSLIAATIILFILGVLLFIPLLILLIVWLWGILDAARAVDRHNLRLRSSY